jgi:sugar-specific transcriptional regulator TrmB
MNLQQVLEEFGLTERQAKVYLALLQLGEASVAEIAAKAQIERTGTYYVLEGLKLRGIVSRFQKIKTDKYVAADPKEILNISKRRQELIESYLPELKAFQNLSNFKPHIQLYEGLDGIKSVWRRTLKKKNTVILSFSGYRLAEETALYYGKEYLEWGLAHIKERAKRNIFTRVITEDSPQARERQKVDKQEAREMRIVPKEKFLFRNEINILDGWVAITSYKELIALVIESKEITETLRNIFELCWEGSAKYSRKNK